MLMAAPSSTPPQSVSYTPACPNLLHKQPHRLILSALSISELHDDFISEDCPQRNCLWDNSHFCPHYSKLCVCVLGALCVCSRPPALSQPWCSGTKKTPFFFPCFTGTINVPRPSPAPLLSFSLAVILSLFPLSPALSLRFLLFIGWCRSRTTNQFQSLSQ